MASGFRSASYEDIFAAWCHFSGDSYFTTNRYPKLLSESEGVLYGLANLSASDTWRTMITVPFYAPDYNSGSTIEQCSCIAAGALPTFGYNFWSSTTPGTYTLTTTTSGLKIDSNPYSFRDGTTPKFIIAAIQGAGGGGAGTDDFDSGAGGGAGGFVCGVIEVSNSMTIKVGYGGRGGKSGSYYDPDLGQNVSDGNADGNSGGQSSITSSDGTVYLKAKGGSYGSRGSSSGGSGGSYESSTSGTHCVKGCSGGRGGGVSNKNAATGCATLTAYCTANTSTTLGSGSGLATYKTWSATSGGAHGYSNWTGGGGGSMLSNGPKGAGGTSNGTNGSLGAGGSGACWTFGAYKQGGAGGDGAVYLFY